MLCCMRRGNTKVVWSEYGNIFHSGLDCGINCLSVYPLGPFMLGSLFEMKKLWNVQHFPFWAPSSLFLQSLIGNQDHFFYSTVSRVGHVVPGCYSMSWLQGKSVCFKWKCTWGKMWGTPAVLTNFSPSQAINFLSMLSGTGIDGEKLH